MTTEAPIESAVDAGAVREQLERILSDHLFQGSKRFSTVLRFIVDSTVEGKHDFLKERVIGMEVFGRTADYDTSLDASVRVAVAEVRKRLVSYYREPGHEHELRIELPIRSYVAKFKQPKKHEPETLEEQQPISQQGGVSLAKIVRVLAVLAILIAAGWCIERAVSPAPVMDKFWAPILTSPGSVWISIGDDKPHPTGTAVPSNSGSSAMLLSNFLQQQPTFPITDLTAASGITAFLGKRGKGYDIQVAQAIKLADLRGVTVVLLGTFRNDWAIRLGADLRFQFRAESPTGLNWIQDLSTSTNRQWAVDLSAPYEEVQRDYALVDRVLDPKTGQWWIGIAGLTGLGTVAAQQLLTDPKAMNELADRLPKDWAHKNLQLVFEVPIVKGSPGNPRAIAIYSW